MAVINRGNIVDALETGLNEIWVDGVAGWKEEFSTIFNIESSDKQSEKDSYLSGFKKFPTKTEGADAEYDTLYQGPSKEYVHATYALGYQITEEAIEDNLYAPDTFNKFPAALSDSAMETVEVVDAAVINGGFANTGPDGVSLFNTAHPLLGGGTQANRPSTDADLSVTSLQAALQAIEDMVNERSLKARTIAQLLVVTTSNMWAAAELLDSAQKPYTANNEINAIQTKNLGYFVYHYLTDADSWFVFSQKEKRKLKHFWRVKLGALRRGNDFDSTNLKHLGRMRFSVGYSHYVGTYGTQGA